MSLETLKDLIAKEEAKVEGWGRGTVSLRQKAVADAIKAFLQEEGKDHDATTVYHTSEAVRALVDEERFWVPRTWGKYVGKRIQDFRKREKVGAYGNLSNPYIKTSPDIRTLPLNQALDLAFAPIDRSEREFIGTSSHLRKNTKFLYMDQDRLIRYVQNNFKRETKTIEVITFPKDW